jgi:hypothetical protein
MTAQAFTFMLEGIDLGYASAISLTNSCSGGRDLAGFSMNSSTAWGHWGGVQNAVI